MSMKTEIFLRELVKCLPALKSVLDEHLSDNFGDVLPHVLMSDIARWSLDALQNSQNSVPNGQSGWEKLLSQLEYWYKSNDDELQELISVSFLENLPYSNEKGASIVDFLGDGLRKQLSVIRQL